MSGHVNRFKSASKRREEKRRKREKDDQLAFFISFLSILIASATINFLVLVVFHLSMLLVLLG